MHVLISPSIPFIKRNFAKVIASARFRSQIVADTQGLLIDVSIYIDFWNTSQWIMIVPSLCTISANRPSALGCFALIQAYM
jgi:hypothetical protein